MKGCCYDLVSFVGSPACFWGLLCFVANPSFFLYRQNGNKIDCVWIGICCGCVGADASVVSVAGWSVWCVCASTTCAVLTCWSCDVGIVGYRNGVCVMNVVVAGEWLEWELVWGQVWRWFELCCR